MYSEEIFNELCEFFAEKGIYFDFIHNDASLNIVEIRHTSASTNNLHTVGDFYKKAKTLPELKELAIHNALFILTFGWNNKFAGLGASNNWSKPVEWNKEDASSPYRLIKA